MGKTTTKRSGPERRLIVKITMTGLSRTLLLLMLISLCGCESLGYYRQAIGGHLSLLRHSKPISHYLNSEQTSGELKSQLRKVQALRQFADQELFLPVKDQYSRYVSLDRNYVVWNVFAAPEFSLQPKTWCYPVAGCAGYRGYYAEAAARRYAAKLQAQGYDVYVAGIAAYSTLGWFKDPVLSSFIYRSDAELADLLFHELAHQLLYIKDDTPFNESFATVVAREGVRRWLQQRDANAAYTRFVTDQKKQQAFIELVTSYREQFGNLYQSNLSDEEKRRRKTALINHLKLDHQKLKEQWGGQSDYDGWFAQDINNAQLNTVATYFDLVPELTRLLAQQNNDLSVFYHECARLAHLSKQQRDESLKSHIH